MQKYQLEKLSILNTVLNAIILELFNDDFDNYDMHINEDYNDFISLRAHFSIQYANTNIIVSINDNDTIDTNVYINNSHIYYQYEILYNNSFMTDIKEKIKYTF